MDLLVIGTAAIFIFILLRMHYSSQEEYYDDPEAPDIWDSGEDPNERPPEGGEKL